MLRTGFTPSADPRHGPAVYMSDDPGESVEYAMKRMKLADPYWKNSPYPSFGVLLACEVAGIGRKIYDEGPFTHAVNKLRSVIIRYTFLVPNPSKRVDFMMQDISVEKRAIEKEILKGFKKIKAGELNG